MYLYRLEAGQVTCPLYSLETIDDVQGHYISQSNWNILIERCPEMMNCFTVLAQFMWYQANHQKDMIVHYNPKIWIRQLYEEGYIIHIVPHKYIASWLGISLRQFLRIKNQLREEFEKEGRTNIIIG